MKLTKKKVQYILIHKKNGESSDTIRKDMKISKRRVDQVWAEYKKTGKEPTIGNNLGRLQPEAIFGIGNRLFGL